VSPYIEEGTVFRSDKTAPDGSIIPYDHTSILATILKWLDIRGQTMLPNGRIAKAPVVEKILSLPAPRVMPTIPPPHPVPLMERVDLHLTEPSNDLEICFAIGLTRRASGAAAAHDPTLPGKLKSHEFLLRYVINQASKLK
jgi:hypothetical protein